MSFICRNSLVQILSTATLAIFAICIAAETNAEEKCRDVLENGIYDRHFSDFTEQNYAYRAMWLSSQQYVAGSSEKRLGIEAVWKSVVGNLQYNEDNFNQFKNSVYSSDVSEAYRYARTTIIKELVPQSCTT